MKVGFAGLGRMGARMAANLVAAGHDVTVWNRSADKAQALAAETGCVVASTPRKMAEGCEAVVTMLADDSSSMAVHMGEDGLFAAAGAGVFVEMGTMSPDHIAALARSAPEGCRVIDAPVSGATQAAAQAKLLIMAGCTEAEAAQVQPLFDAMGRATIFLGHTGGGTVMKLAVNSLIHGINQALSEAMTLAEAAGIAPEAAFDVIENSAAAAPMISYRRPLYLDEAAHEVTFTVSLARKDMEITAALAASLGTPMRQGAVTLDVLKKAEDDGYGARDMASILNFTRKESS
ncbi:NAD(P)-dependent oxidoreductase [Maritimibacter sp. UBA3975]|uniref:NAD(P)-dependent oxidoreductase n=1 Tax=Maritimibacter sp. UBA3975 TaxID=1946833 RepID=UPI000C090D10|nr:NAD(P)-dependent oxidoreductase [Maritimibacter sp. UBA3975]MAM61475.1 6-phosphogluconate dehydrogenase [Maritimibacter sp.]|tara:strand:- start:3531 stop:4400 length:870 start_codon:yes stop_codon:yes gene_type:complete